MVNAVMTFVGYTACFWLVWKLYDFGLKKFVLRNRDPEDTDCIECVRYEHKTEKLKKSEATASNTVRQLNEESRRLKKENRELREQVAVLRKFAPTLLDFLNKAKFHELTAIPNIGKVKANRIMTSRPFHGHNEIYKALSATETRYVQNWYQRQYGVATK